MNDDCGTPQPPPAEGESGTRAGPRWGREKVRAALGLAVWETNLAVESGLLTRGEDRRFDPVEVQKAVDDIEGFRARLRAEHRLNATEAAARLGISVQRFARVVEQAGLVPVAEEGFRKYGRFLTVRYYRAADVEALAPYAHADRVLREAVTSVGRSAVAQKAARTRARNKARATEARSELDALHERAKASPVSALRYATALALGLPDSPPFLRRYQDDDLVRTLIGMIDDSRLTVAERSTKFSDVQDLAHEAHSTMASPDEVRQQLGADISTMAAQAETIGRFMPRQELSRLAAAPPTWLLALRAAEAAADAESAALHARMSAERKVLDSAERALRITDDTAAELFGLPVDVVASLRPKKHSGHWHPQHVAQLLAHPPAWLHDEAAARQEVARRQARKAK